MDSDVVVDLEQKLNRDLKKIQKEYATYVDQILDIVREKNVTPEQLCSYVISLPASNKTDDEAKLQLLFDLEADLRSATKVEEIFRTLNYKYTSFLDYEIFEMVLERYGSKEDQERLNYPVNLKEFIEQHKIEEFIELNPELINPRLQELGNDSKTIKIKFNIKETQSLRTLKEVTNAVANILWIRASTLRLCGVEKGCVLETLLISNSIADKIFTREREFLPEQEVLFRTALVSWLECNKFHNFKLYYKKAPTEDQLNITSPGNVKPLNPHPHSQIYHPLLLL